MRRKLCLRPSPVGDLAPLEALVWSWLFLPRKRPLAAFAKASGSTRQAAHNAKACGLVELEAAAKGHSTFFEVMLDAEKRGQKAVVRRQGRLNARLLRAWVAGSIPAWLRRPVA